MTVSCCLKAYIKIVQHKKCLFSLSSIINSHEMILWSFLYPVSTNVGMEMKPLIVFRFIEV